MPIRSAILLTACAAASAGAGCPPGVIFQDDEILVFITDEGGLIGYGYDNSDLEPTDLLRIPPGQATSVAIGGGTLLRPRPLDIANGTGAVLFSVGRPFGSGLPSSEYGIIDPETQQIEFIDTLGDPAIPDGLFGWAWGVNATGTAAAGAYNDGGLVVLPLPFAWIDGEGTRLPLPASAAALPVDEVSAWANTVSDDGRLIGGNWLRSYASNGRSWVSYNDLNPESRAVVWLDGEVTELPHAPVHQGEPRASDLRLVSDDGTAIVGSTWRWTYVRDLPEGRTSWDRTDPRSWILRGGVFEFLDDDPVEEFRPVGMSADASIMIGRLDRGTVFGERSAMIWTRETGAVFADDFLAGLGVDLSGVVLDGVIDVSGNGEWLLLGVYDLSRVCDSGYIRLRVPCSPADLTADRAITLDDLLAYVERFTGGNELADLSGDGLLDLADIVAFLTLYADGCPG